MEVLALPASSLSILEELDEAQMTAQYEEVHKKKTDLLMLWEEHVYGLKDTLPATSLTHANRNPGPPMALTLILTLTLMETVPLQDMLDIYVSEVQSPAEPWQRFKASKEKKESLLAALPVNLQVHTCLVETKPHPTNYKRTKSFLRSPKHQDHKQGLLEKDAVDGTEWFGLHGRCEALSLTLLLAWL